MNTIRYRRYRPRNRFPDRYRRGRGGRSRSDSSFHREIFPHPAGRYERFSREGEEIMTDVKWKFDTAVIHGAQAPGEWKSATLAPIYQTASHRFDTAEELSDVFAGKKAGFIYQRLRNPTNQVLEKRLSLLTGGLDAVVTGAGVAALNNPVLRLCPAGGGGGC